MPLVWFDISLVLVGVLGLALWVRGRFRARSRGSIPMTLTLCLSLLALTAAGAEVGLSKWEDAQRPFDPNATDISAVFRNLMSEVVPMGSPAPDFALPRLEDEKIVRLSDYRGRKPVALIFGSFRCDIFCVDMVHLLSLHQSYGNRVEFLFVHITEAPHALPDDLLRILEDPAAPQNAEDNLRWRLRQEMKYFQIPFPCLVDTNDCQVEMLYRAFPRRLVLVDSDGLVGFDSGYSPFHAAPWHTVAAWFDKQTQRQTAGKDMENHPR